MNEAALLLDCETTGVGEPIEAIEVAWLVLEPLTLKVLNEFEQRYRPGKPIECGALATHHIMDEDLATCPPASEAKLPTTAYIIGQAIDYDYGVMGSPPGVKRIDTCALSRALWPECDSFKMGAVLYYVDRLRARELMSDAHGALSDCLACYELLKHIVARFNEPPSWETLWRASEKARIPKHWAFGKHKGTAISDTPRDYLEWFAKQSDADPYVLIAVRRALGRPTKEAA